MKGDEYPKPARLKVPQRTESSQADRAFMRRALRLAQRGYGCTSPNPMVGAVLVAKGRIIGRGWHRRAGEAHAETEAIRDAQLGGQQVEGATLYVTLEPCSTFGRTPPCTEAILAAGIRRVVVAATDPNPKHSGKAYRILRRAGLIVEHGLLAKEAVSLNEAFNHWIVQRTPFVTVKAAMTLDGKIATTSGESKWITSQQARAWVMKLRRGADAILVGVNTVFTDDPSLTFRAPKAGRRAEKQKPEQPRRIILDSFARTPVAAQVIADEFSGLTTVVVTKAAPKNRTKALSARVNVMLAPQTRGRVDLRWLLARLGAEGVTRLLVEGGGEVNASFLLQGLAQRVAFFYAPKILGGSHARKGVAGDGAGAMSRILGLRELHWRRVGPDLLLTARAGCSF